MRAMTSSVSSDESPMRPCSRIVADWPRTFDAQRAHALGFRAESSFEEIIRVYIDDELGGKLP